MTSQPSADSLGHVLVTGGCGFLGSHIIALLLERYPSTQIDVLDLHTSRNRYSSPNITYHDGDLTDYEVASTLLSSLKPDAVLHTASPPFNAQQDVLYKVNVDGTKTLLRAAQEAGVKAFVYTSSASIIYDARTELINANETYPLVTGNDQPEYYTSTKAWAETAVLTSNRSPQYPTFLTVSIRPSGIFGERDATILPNMCTAYFKNQHTFQLGANDNLFDFTYVGNVAWGHILATKALLQTHNLLPTVPLDTERVDGEAFFITNGSPVYFWDFARTVWRECGSQLGLGDVWVLPKGLGMFISGILENVFWCLGKKPNLTRQAVRYACMTRYFDIGKAKTRLGYQPLVELEEGIKKGVRSLLEEKGLGEKKS